jgi:Rab3 GTPase-activating protein catalytic subunit
VFYALILDFIFIFHRQVINLCIDMATAMEVQRQQRKLEKLEKRRTLEDFGVDGNKPLDGNVKRKTSSVVNSERNIISNELEKEQDTIMDIVTASGSDLFEDALSEDDFETESAAAIVAAAKRSLDMKKLSLDLQSRKGARCPVPGSSLVATGDQTYAPYLQRPYPLTDDVIAERHTMLSRDCEPSRSHQNSVYKRLEISYRLQKPKLLSDMAAFKAANPGSIFQDFLFWYGNPGSPLDEYVDTRSSSVEGSTIGDLLLGQASVESVAVKLDKAAEAIQMLNETREFWSRTWEEATPIPASEQKLLFDVTGTVEMALDFMENMHPAILVNQVMAVNLAASYFTLVSAAKEVGALKVGGPVQRSFQRLREKTEKALELLSADATRSTSAACNVSRRKEGGSNFVSLGVISACDDACTALSEAEVVTARATSLLNKFPSQYGLVESFLMNSPGDDISLTDENAQSQILQTIHRQQLENKSKAKRGPAHESKANAGAMPELREYVLRNLDDSSPCQLSVRFADDSVMLHRASTKPNRTSTHAATSCGGMIVALTKCLLE